MLGGFLLKGYAANIKLRTLVHGTPTIQSVVTFYGGYLKGKVGTSSDEESDSLSNLKSDQIGSQHLYVVSNTSWYINPYSILTGQVAVGNFGVLQGKPGSINHLDLSVTNLFVGGSYQHFISPTMGFEGAGMFPLYTKVALDSTGGSVDLQSQDLDTSNALFYMIRGSFVWKTSDSWILNMAWLLLELVDLVQPYLGLEQQ